MLFLLHSAHAASVFTSVGAEAELGTSGTWGRLFSLDEGWAFFEAAGGDGWYTTIADDLSGFDDHARTNLTNVANLDDIQAEACPDGGWLVIGSWGSTVDNDSGTGWRVEPDLSERWSTVIGESSADYRYNDMVTICAVDGEEGMLAQRVAGEGAWLPLDGGTVGGARFVDVVPTGAGWARRESDGENFVSWSQDGGFGAFVDGFDQDWNELESLSLDLPGGTIWWPERLQALGDGWLLTWLGGSPGNPFGDVWLGYLDADFNLVDSVQLTDDAAHGDGRPWFDRKGTTVAVTFDRDVHPYVVTVELDPSLVPDDDPGGDTGAVDSGGEDTAPVDSGEGGGAVDSAPDDSATGDSAPAPTDTSDGDTAKADPADDGGCGCATGGGTAGAGAGLGLVAAALARRRRG